ncbi:uncharacterized protein N7511_008867 [Penicillium nucicola]|uniref:uncharacterized protein n=1 Tax=Penicillium nucicola TaxID=1850975 RepID=UPI002544F320|nr:uncharacterized protein N7511_008867 [Penicillium nucicola]KAJ5747171.1 hypothetical protein N7511_008867 [Penicillium nucicola]
MITYICSVTKPQEEMPAHPQSSPVKYKLAMPYIEPITWMTWKETYEAECKLFKQELTFLTRILRYDPKQLGVDRIEGVCRRLAAPSFQVGRVLEATMAMIEEDQDCEYVRRASSGWFVGAVEDSEIEIYCSILEYRMGQIAEKLRRDYSFDLIIAAELEVMIVEFEEDFGV